MRPTLQFLTEKTFKGLDFLTRHIMRYRFTSICCKIIHVKATKTVNLTKNHKHTFAPYVGRGVGPNSGLICSNNKRTVSQIKELYVSINLSSNYDIIYAKNARLDSCYESWRTTQNLTKNRIIKLQVNPKQ